MVKYFYASFIKVYIKITTSIRFFLSHGFSCTGTRC